MEPYLTQVLPKSSCKVFPSRTTQKRLLLRNQKNKNQNSDLEFHNFSLWIVKKTRPSKYLTCSKSTLKEMEELCLKSIKNFQ